MIYLHVTPDSPLSQGDIIDCCPILVWEDLSTESTALDPVELKLRVIVVTQACDLAQSRVTRVVVAVVHSAQTLVDQGVLKGKAITDQIRSHRVYG